MEGEQRDVLAKGNEGRNRMIISGGKMKRYTGVYRRIVIASFKGRRKVAEVFWAYVF